MTKTLSSTGTGEQPSKVDLDLHYLMDAFCQAMRNTGDDSLAELLPWIGEREASPEDCTPRLVQAYSIAFQLLNMVEENTANQIRRRHEEEQGLLYWNGMWGTQLKALREAGMDQDAIAEALAKVRVEPVLTAHPTEAKRITVLELHRELYLAMVTRENRMWTPSEREDIAASVRSIIERLWRTGEIYLTKPSVAMERQGMEYYLTQIFPVAAQRTTRRLQHAWRALGFDPERLKSCQPQIRFGTWVGGDRDGHPLVTPRVTEDTLLSFRINALRIHKRTLEKLRARLSLSELLQPVPEQLLDGIAAQWDVLGNKAATICARNEGEPWRQFVSLMIARIPLEETGHADNVELSTNYFTSYRFTEELLQDLHRLRESLLAVNARHIVDEEIEPAIEQCRNFGFHLAALDIRQNSAFHDKAIGQILQTMGRTDCDYASWDEEKRLTFLNGELDSSQHRLRHNDQLGEEATAVIGALSVVGRYVRRYGCDGIGALILSMTRSVSDLLALYFLAREAGLLVNDEDGQPVCPLPVVPLLETVEDLEQGASIVEGFLAHPMTQRSHAWMNLKRGDTIRTEAVQQVMIGYSDSNKDKGIFASQWTLHHAQAQIAEAGRKRNTRIRFFHGRGGTISRGAGPTDRFLEALPRGTLGFDLRTTEQGEVIAQKFANLLTATYNLELLMAGACRHSCEAGNAPADPALETVLQRISDTSASAYSALLDMEGFMTFYRQATPIDVLEMSRIGSRPARRTGTHTLDDLRAIPWVFSWSQARFFLPGWYGTGTALQRLGEESPEGYARLREAAGTHPFLVYVLTNIEASIISVDHEVMREYASLVQDNALRERFLLRIEEEYGWVNTHLDALLGEPLHVRRPNFANTIKRRGDALKVLHNHQVNLLRQWRSRQADNDDEVLLDELLLTVNAIAGGLKTTG